MAIHTLLRIFTKDAQGVAGYTETVEVGVTDAGFGATTLPTEALIHNLIAAIFGSGTGFLSTSIVTGYEVAVFQDTPITGAFGGDGSVATAIAARTRNQIGDFPDLDGWELRIPGMNKSNMIYDPTNANAIVTSVAPWIAVKAAAAAVGYKDPSGVIVATPGVGEIMQIADVFNGKRGPKKPR